MDIGIAVSRDDFEEIQKTTPTHSHALGKFKFQPKPFNSTNFKEYNRNELLTKTFAKNSKTTNLLSKLPDVVTAANTVQDRFIEIDQMETAIKRESGSRTALQYLPRHLRRRAASHDIKRFPRSLRGIAHSQQEKSNTKKKEGLKPPPRKRKRQSTKNINGQDGRIYTHVWHAKRFHIQEKYGNKNENSTKKMVPQKSTGHSVKSIIKSVKQAAVVQDLSWWDCYENLDEVLPDNMLRSKCDKFTFVHPAGNFSSSTNEVVNCVRFRLSGNKSKAIVLGLLNDREFLKGMKNGEFREVCVKDASVTRPEKKKSFISLNNNLEKIETEKKLANLDKNVTAIIKAVEYRQGPLQCFEIIIPNPEKYHKSGLILPVWINLIYQGAHAIGEEEAVFYEHEIRDFMPSFPVDFLDFKSYNDEYEVGPVVDKWKKTPMGKRVNYAVQNPDIISDKSKYDMNSPELNSLELKNPELKKPDLKNPDMKNPDIKFPDIKNSETGKTERKNSISDTDLQTIIRGYHSIEINNYTRVKIHTRSRGVIRAGARLFPCSTLHLDKLAISEQPESLINNDVKYNGPIFSKEEFQGENNQNRINKGFVTSAWFSQKYGRSVAIGFVENKFITPKTKDFLLKNANSLQLYHVWIEKYSDRDISSLYDY